MNSLKGQQKGTHFLSLYKILRTRLYLNTYQIQDGHLDIQLNMLSKVTYPIWNFVDKKFARRASSNFNLKFSK